MEQNKEITNESLYKIKDDTLYIFVGTDLDHHRADLIKRHTDWYIRNYQFRDIVFDFENTNFMDSSGIGMIMGRYKSIKGWGGTVGAINITPNVDRILKISGLYKIMNIKKLIGGENV